MGNNQRLLIIFTTCGSKEDAEDMARRLVQARIAACAQVSGPISSFYWWENKLEKDQEWRVSFKVLSENYLRAEELIKEHHPYELPQIVAVPVEKGLDEFINWVAKETQ